MATFLDVGLFSYFSVIFPVLLVFLLVFAVLTKTKFFGDNKGVYALIAFALAMMMLFTPGIIKVISVMAPWFVFIFIFFTLGILTLMILGTSSDSITKYMSEWDTVHWFILAFAIIIAIGSLASVYGGSLLPYTSETAAGETVEHVSGENASAETATTGRTTSTGDFNQNVGRVLFHPKVIGMIFVLLVASFTIRMMASKNG
ncbi:MAG: hypothetical protein KJ574_05065 [Nanoarchaeota archaeon]|nr:hypothetical protein [Nanoarchaeota archaeon]